MLKRAQDLQETLSAVRQDIHKHPELSFQEYRTAQLVAERLAELGIAARTGVGKTGVIGDLLVAGNSPPSATSPREQFRATRWPGKVTSGSRDSIFHQLFGLNFRTTH